MIWLVGFLSSGLKSSVMADILHKYILVGGGVAGVSCWMSEGGLFTKTELFV
jgi:hypothetical protein